jgi:hypothetical protein
LRPESCLEVPNHVSFKCRLVYGKASDSKKYQVAEVAFLELAAYKLISTQSPDFEFIFIF